jgi:hypothetical protein
MIDFQSPTTALRPCPLGTFENSQQHARVIYGWVHGSQQIPSPVGTAEIFSRLRLADSVLLVLCEKQFVLIRAIRVKRVQVKKESKLQNEPNFHHNHLSINKI